MQPIVRHVIHGLLHTLAPMGLALLVAKRIRFTSSSRGAFFCVAAIMSSMLIDLDHLLATPVYSPGRCSVGFHLLHSYYVMPVYVAMAMLVLRTDKLQGRRFKIFVALFGVGACLHLVTDFVDCLMM